MYAARCLKMIVWLVVPLGATFVAGDEYQTSDEALRAASKPFQARDYAAARAPLEVALRLAPDDKTRLRVQRMLLESYRLLDDVGPFVEAAEFIITRGEDELDRLSVSQGLAAFWHQRGKLEQGKSRYEARLSTDAKDLLAITMLWRIAEGPGRDRDAAAKYAEQREPLEKQRATERAAQLEQQAAGDPAQATWLWKQAAKSWQRAGKREAALRAARQAEKLGPDMRSPLLTFFWYRELGELFLAEGDPAAAVVHLQQAVERATIEGYKKQAQTSLDQARAAAANQKP